ncbi:hypothetical protein FACS1894219_09880 [Clostridia bacterium]|nr:hypothetical protein FACS1894219_09880 [Clostridia bacterium]
MNSADIYKLKREALMEAFEKERQEWLASGMSEADIYRIHFGDYGKDKGERNGAEPDYGDYGVWLSERKHIRPDHKYAPGVPLSLESVKYEGSWFKDIGATDELLNIEQKADIEVLLLNLTDYQRRCFEEVRLNGRTQSDVAAELCVSRESAKQAVAGAVKKLKKFFQ